MFPRDRRHLRSRHQTLRGDLRLLRGRTIATPSRPLNHLKPTDAARLRDVQLDVHFAVCNHTATSLIRGQLCTLLSCSARGDQRSAYAIQITMENLVISPAEASAKVGDTIEWIDKDIFVHTATARNGDWDVAMPPKKTVTLVLKKAGLIDYYCRFHPNMKATLE